MPLILLACLLQACGSNASNNSNDDADSANDIKNMSKPVVVIADKDDAKFAADAAANSLAAIELGKLAIQKGLDKRIKNFGAMMVKDYSKINTKLTILAKAKNINLPGAITADQQQNMDKLAKNTGKAFDKAYIDIVVSNHNKDIALFQFASNNCFDPDIKAFAGKHLPTLKRHLETINTIHDSIK